MEFSRPPKSLTVTQTLDYDTVSGKGEEKEPYYYRDDRIKNIVYDDPGAENWISRCQATFRGWCQNYSKFLIRLILVSLFVGYTVYFVFAILYNVDTAVALIAITGLTVLGICWVKIRDNYGDAINEKFYYPVVGFFEKRWHWMQWYVTLKPLFNV